MNWYYAQGDQRQGPLSDSEFEALITAGTINEKTLVWKDGMPNWLPLKEARPAGATAGTAPAGWIRCTATGRLFPPEEIVYIDGKPYSAAAKPAVLQSVLQSGALPTSELERNGPPWERRQELGFFPAIVQTVRGILLEPAILFAGMKRTGGLATPLGYHVLLSWMGGLAAIGYQAIYQFGLRSAMPHPAQSPVFPAVLGVGFFIGWEVFMPVVLVIASFISSGILHLSLMLCQGAKQPFETTFRTYCYTSGSLAPLQFIPFCGAYIAGIWGLVSMCIGMAKTHEITTGRAVLAVLLPTVLCCAAAFFIIAAIMGSVIAAQAAHPH